MKLDATKKAVRPGHFVDTEWPYQPRFKRVNGWRIHYIDEGAGDPVVLLHGNPAWGFLPAHPFPWKMQRTNTSRCGATSTIRVAKALPVTA